MKLYTEEQLKEAFNCGRLYLGREGDTNFYHLIDKLTPIELPNNEKIEQEMNNKYPLTGHIDIAHKNYLKRVGYIQGAKYVIGKIQGGNK